MESERGVVVFVCGEEAVVAGGVGDSFIVKKGLGGSCGLDGLIAMCQQHDFGGFISVVCRTTTKVARKFAVQADVVLVFGVVGCNPIIGDGVSNVVSARQVASSASDRIRPSRENLEIQCFWISTPTSIDEMLAV